MILKFKKKNSYLNLHGKGKYTELACLAEFSNLEWTSDHVFFISLAISLMIFSHFFACGSFSQSTIAFDMLL